MEHLAEGAHVAILYADPADRDAHLIPYLSAALRTGHSGVCVTSVDADELADRVRRAAPGSTAGLEVRSAATTYLQEDRFAGPAMVSWLAGLAAAAPTGSASPRLAIAGDLNCLSVLDRDGLAEMFAYEAALDALAAGCRHTFACFYDLTQLPAQYVIDVFRSHRRVLVGGAFWDSPFYTAPGPVRGDDQAPDAALGSSTHHNG
jgi:hypothetical protein